MRLRSHGPLVSCSETLERGLTGTGLGRGIEVGHCVQPSLARLPGAGLCAEYRHQNALILWALEAVKGGPSSRQLGGSQHLHRHGISPNPRAEPGITKGRAPSLRK